MAATALANNALRFHATSSCLGQVGVVSCEAVSYTEPRHGRAGEDGVAEVQRVRRGGRGGLAGADRAGEEVGASPATLDHKVAGVINKVGEMAIWQTLFERYVGWGLIFQIMLSSCVVAK